MTSSKTSNKARVGRPATDTKIKEPSNVPFVFLKVKIS